MRLDETMREVMRGDGPKPIALIEQGMLRSIVKGGRSKRGRRAVSVMKDTGVQTGETLDRAIQAILQPIPSLKRNSSPPGQGRVFLQDPEIEK
jgi:hypothetical protein